MSRTRFALTSPARHAAVELRAYLAAERAGFAGDPVAFWLAAEAAEARSDAAKRGAATRAAKARPETPMALPAVIPASWAQVDRGHLQPRVH